jgi:hypothetical protein
MFGNMFVFRSPPQKKQAGVNNPGIVIGTETASPGL